MHAPVDLNTLSFDELPESLQAAEIPCCHGPLDGKKRKIEKDLWQQGRGLHVDVQLGGVGFGDVAFLERIRHWRGYYRLGVVEAGHVVLVWDGPPPPS